MSLRQVVRLASKEHKREWNEFVSCHSEATPYHLFEWSSIFEAAYGKKSHFLRLDSPRGLEGVLPLVLMRGPLARNRLVSLPFLDLGGVVASSSQAAQTLWQASLELAHELRASGVELRGGCLPAEEDSAGASRVRFLLPLPGTRERLWRDLGPKVRNQIRKSEKEGLETHRVGIEGLSSFYRIFARRMRDLGSPVHSRSLFEKVLALLGDHADLYLTCQPSGEPVAGGICLRNCDTAVVPWASSLPSARSLCPNHSLYWAILCDLQAAGAGVFDFGRSSVGSGTYHFKKQWGGMIEPLLWRSYNVAGEVDQRTYLDPRRHVLLTNIWSRLPVPLAEWLGPKLRRHLPH